MANMREIRNRISSVQGIMRITNAMYLMASSKLKRARNRLDAVAPYFNRTQETISDLLNHSEEFPCIYIDSGEYDPDTLNAIEADKYAGEDRVEPKRLVLVITSDKGLAGAYNHNVIRMTNELLEENPDKKTLMYCVGYNGRNEFKARENVEVDDNFCYPAVEPEDWRCLYMANQMVHLFKEGEVDEVHVVYTRMLSVMNSEVRRLQVLPLKKETFKNKNKVFTPPIYLPSPKHVLEQIIPTYVKGVLFGAMVHSFASEQNARMQAMDNATSNAKEMVKDLSLQYNRVRQAAITQEITEVVGGAESLQD